MSDAEKVYSPEEFAQICKTRGYAKCIREARDWVKNAGKDEFTEEDFYKAYREMDTDNQIGRRNIGYAADGRYYGDAYMAYDSYLDDIRWPW